MDIAKKKKIFGSFTFLHSIKLQTRQNPAAKLINNNLHKINRHVKLRNIIKKEKKMNNNITDRYINTFLTVTILQFMIANSC